MLKGQILLVPSAFDDAKVGTSAARFWKFCRRRLEEEQTGNSFKSDFFDDLIAENFASIDFPAVKFDFSLCRNGELRLSCDDATSKRLVSQSSNGKILRPMAVTTAFKQAYYFVKDAVHCHTHHGEESDQLTPLVATMREGQAVTYEGKSAEYAWVAKTVWDMSRAIDESERSGRRDRLRTALGISHYLSAFLKQHAETLADGSSHSRERIVNLESRQQSIKLTLDHKGGRVTAIVAAMGSSVIVFLSTISAIRAVVGSTVPLYPSIYEFKHQMTLIVAGMSAMMISFVYFCVYRGEAFSGLGRGWIRSVISMISKAAWAVSMSMINWASAALWRRFDWVLPKANSMRIALAFVFLLAVGLLLAAVAWRLVGSV